jgi:GNAT superfamily N-acetyltransferase
MKTKYELLDIIKSQLAIEYNCTVNDFSASKNRVTIATDSTEKRHYTDGAYFFQMITFGNNVIISANECIHGWINEFIKNKIGYHLFEQNNLLEINEYLGKFNKRLGNSRHMFVSNKKTIPENENIQVKWFEQNDIKQFYDNKIFPTALNDEYDPKCPDILAIGGYSGNEMTGMAGCTADTPVLSQISVEVDKKYWGKGIGPYLVILLKNELERRGRIPLYGTSLSNINSWKTAIKSGFSPEWIEITTIDD